DALALDGRDLRSLPLEERKACLRLLLPARGVVHFGDHVLEQGREFFDAACGARLEGVVAKKRDSPYVGKRSRDWLKVKCQLRQEFVIGGYTAARGSRAHHGVEPTLVCEVRFPEWTADGGIRHPTFLGLRDDKRPEDCVREVPTEPASPPPPLTWKNVRASPSPIRRRCSGRTTATRRP